MCFLLLMCEVFILFKGFRIFFFRTSVSQVKISLMTNALFYFQIHLSSLSSEIFISVSLHRVHNTGEINIIE